MPTWVMVFVAIVLLGGAAWLFLADPTSQQPPVEQSRQDDDASRDDDDSGGPGAERELTLPDDDADGAKDGRDDGEDPADPSTDDAPDDLPPAYASLRGQSIAIGTAAYATTGTGPLTRKVGGLDAPCDPDPDPSEELRALEAQLRDELATLLRRARATVVPVATTGPCAALRAHDLHDADHAVVVRVVDGDQVRVLRARAARTAPVATLADSATLATELAGAFELRGVVAATAIGDRRVVTNAGAIDLTGGSTLAVVELGRDLLASEDQLHEAATHVADALAAVATRADIAPPTG